MRGLRRGFSERYKYHLYDYQRIDATNPRQVASDEALPNVGEPNYSSFSVAVWLYAVGGALTYFMARLLYDTEWDRYYHINYPASMEYFDVLSVYYVKRLKDLDRSLPRSLSDLLPDVTPAYKRWEATKELPQTKKEEDELVNTIIDTMLDADKLPDKIAPRPDE